MKEMNRREFLTLTGASVALLALAACGGAPSTPVVPTTGEEAKVLEAINKVWKEKFEEANETPHTVKDPDHKIIFGELNGLEDKIRNKYGKDSLAGMAGISEPSPENVVALEDAYSCEDAAVRAFVAKLLDNSNSAKAEFISIYLPVVQGKTYMTAVVFRNNKA